MWAVYRIQKLSYENKNVKFLKYFRLVDCIHFEQDYSQNCMNKMNGGAGGAKEMMQSLKQ